MAVRKRKDNGRWMYQAVVKLPNGKRKRISGHAPRSRNTKTAAEKAERGHVDRVLDGTDNEAECPTMDQWFNGRFWREWVVARKNKPSEVESKESIYRVHLKDAFGSLRLDEIDVGTIARFKATLVESGRKDKTINNILAVLSKSLRYAEDVKLIASAPKVGILKAERPEIVTWDFEQYARLLSAARAADPTWYAAVCLAGEAGLRIGEVRELDWRKDVDLVAGTITVNRQTRRGKTGTPKGRTRRTVPMTWTLRAALKAMSSIRTGYVIRNPDGSAMTDNQSKYYCYRLCRLAGLDERGWHCLRHCYGTHAAMFGVNPWKLMTWMGHKRIDETMRYVHFAEAHLRPLPKPVVKASMGQEDPDRRVLAMLSARGRASTVQQPAGAETARPAAHA